MTENEFQSLNVGDIIRHKSDSAKHFFVVTGNYGGRITAVRTVDATHPSEWDLVLKADMKSHAELVD